MILSINNSLSACVHHHNNHDLIHKQQYVVFTVITIMILSINNMHHHNNHDLIHKQQYVVFTVITIMILSINNSLPACMHHHNNPGLINKHTSACDNTISDLALDPLNHLIPLGKFRSPSLGNVTGSSQKAAPPIPNQRTQYFLIYFLIHAVPYGYGTHIDVDACDCTWGLGEHHKIGENSRTSQPENRTRVSTVLGFWARRSTT